MIENKTLFQLSTAATLLRTWCSVGQMRRYSKLASPSRNIEFER